jgi:predicted DNA-binding ribbon-helix-helix protein
VEKAVSRTQRAQILMEPAEYRRLEALARRRKVSVAELVRQAVKACYLTERPAGANLADAIAGMALPVGDWEAMEADLLQGYDERLP